MDASQNQTAPHLAPPQGKESYHRLAEFSLSLIQAMLRTGYYASGHPEAEKSLEGLYQQFRDAIEDRSELAFLVAQMRDGRDISIEGYDPVPLTLHQVMMKGMADLFAPKFLAFFDRWGLLSFSIRDDCTAEDFHAFVELMSQPPSLEQSSISASDRLTQNFVDRGIVHISTVFKQDIIGRERRLPWRVEMALSRLRRDLKLLPLYKHATPEELRVIKLQIIDDVIRPMRTPVLLKDFLVNCDLVAADISILEENQVEREIAENLNEKMLLATARLIVDDLRQIDTQGGDSSSEIVTEVKARMVGVLRALADKLCSMSTGLEHDFLETLVAEGVLSVDELSPEIRHAIATRRLAKKFVARRDPYVECLSQIGPDKAGRDLAAVVFRIFPDLLHTMEYETAALILEAVVRGRSSPMLAQLARALTRVVDKDAAGHLLAEFPELDKDDRRHALAILVFAGEAAVPGLLSLYVKSQNKSVRMALFEAMRRIGLGALRPLLKQLPQIEQEWDVLHHILAELGEHGDASLADSVSQFLYHTNPHVRHASLTALSKLQGADAEGHFLHALLDDEAEVRQAAVACLGAIKSRHPQAFEFYDRALAADGKAKREESDAVVVQVCGALAAIAELPDQTARAESMLLAALQPSARQGVRAWLKRTSARHSESVRAAVCNALGAIGTLAALEPLRQIAQSEGDAVAARAADAATQIEERLSAVAPETS